MTQVASSENVNVVLVQPKLSENIGMAARAAANMGLGGLALVDPYRFDPEQAAAVATRMAAPMIEAIQIFDDLAAALADRHFAVATTARKGSDRGPFFTPRTVARKVRDLGPDQKVSIVFGPERSGLTTADLRLCQAVVTIPTADPKTSSLNLAQAVLILGYELLLADAPPSNPGRLKPAPMGELNHMYQRLAETLVRIGFLPDENTDHWLMSFKRIFNRTGLTLGDCNLWRGVCRQIDWALDNADRVPPARSLSEMQSPSEAAESEMGIDPPHDPT